MCQLCYDKKSTLNVHHRRYLSNKDPWDYPNHLLVTLCEECHEVEKERMENVSHDLMEILKETFFAGEIASIAGGFINFKIFHSSEIDAAVISWAISNENLIQDLHNKYFEYLSSKTKK